MKTMTTEGLRARPGDDFTMTTTFRRPHRRSLLPVLLLAAACGDAEAGDSTAAEAEEGNAGFVRIINVQTETVAK